MYAALVSTAVIPTRRPTSVNSSWTERGNALRICSRHEDAACAACAGGRTYTRNCRGGIHAAGFDHGGAIDRHLHFGHREVQADVGAQNRLLPGIKQPLNNGDEIIVEVEKIGSLCNRIRVL